MNDLEDNMRMNFYRVLCPASHVLGDYQLGMLSADQHNEIQSHLSKCPHCQRELAELATFMNPS